MPNSSMWLRFGNISPQDKARHCHLQDRNMLAAEKGMWQHCRQRVKTDFAKSKVKKHSYAFGATPYRKSSLTKSELTPE
ncbi:unnamed protein product [Thelazia callipaeda]|uniref:Transposase n=1 Tax=Thelazia callipaeda TaxID=103827 RepID=A0A0N5CTB6_THECL|nr:unnamed protein product [Thelazia callipaeda]